MWPLRTAIYAGAIIAAWTVAGATAGLAQAAPAAPSVRPSAAATASVTRQEFVTKAAISDKYEIDAGYVAERRSHNTQVIRFARLMIRDHGRTTAKLKLIVAHNIGLRLPFALDAMHASLIRQLRTAPESNFNSLYAEQQVRGHEDALALFSAYAAHGGNGTLRHFASSTLPMIHHHLYLARRLPVGGGRTASRL